MMNGVVHDAAARRFTLIVDGQRAELDYQLSRQVMHITHTGVPPAIGGRGVAAKLMQAACQAARDNSWQVDPLCSYAAAYLSKHPDEVPRRD